MSTEQIVGLCLALLIMLIGFIGNLVPGIPGTPVVLIAAIGHRLYFGQESAGPVVLLMLVLFTAISLVLDFLATYFGAKKMGATWRGGLGAAMGGLIGLFFGIPGIILGPFLGATIAELIGGHEFKKATKAGVGATLGLLASAIGKSAVCVVMIGLFTFSVIYRS